MRLLHTSQPEKGLLSLLPHTALKGAFYKDQAQTKIHILFVQLYFVNAIPASFPVHV